LQEIDNGQPEKWIWEVINNSIRLLVKRFEETPYFFVKESDVQCYLYHLLINDERFSALYQTRDAKKTCLVHTEYSSDGGLPLDLVIFNPQMVSKKRFKKQDLICSIELKLWHSAGYNPEQQIKIRETYYEKGIATFIIYLARGGNWSDFKEKIKEVRVPEETIFLESDIEKILVTKILYK
jgi:hypothetical protein